MTEIIELAEKDVKTAFINIINMLKDIKKNMNIMRRKIEYIYKDPYGVSRGEKIWCQT